MARALLTGLGLGFLVALLIGFGSALGYRAVRH